MYDQRHNPSFRRAIRASVSMLGLCFAWGLSAQQPVHTSHLQHTAKTRSAQDTSQATLRAHAKLSEDSARKIALTKVTHGTIQSSELEREHGRLIYSFDIKVAGKSGIDEVNIDAITGAVVARAHETPAKEKREAQQEVRETTKPHP